MTREEASLGQVESLDISFPTHQAACIRKILDAVLDLSLETRLKFSAQVINLHLTQILLMFSSQLPESVVRGTRFF